ncbi:MAG: hypothetical protein JW940_12290, partial [Polyangiaceae bacterium]|nr:hypothetical protein [Polyangiaceae bacterium]
EETDAFWAAMNARVNYDIAWTTGVANNNGYFNADVNASSYNGATATYAYLHSVSGKPIFVDDGCGNTAAEAWSTSSASELNELIAAGVMAFNDCDGVSGSFASLVEALRPQLNSTCN